MQEVYLGLSGAIATERRVSVIANNLANVTTAGFYSDHISLGGVTARPDYAVLAKSTADELNAPPPRQSFYDALHVEISRDTIDFSPGIPRHSGIQTDAMVWGEGFFAVETPQGERYTRQGNFLLAADGTLMSQDGLPILSRSGGNITIDAPTFTIEPDGDIVDSEGNQLGSLRVVSFPDKRMIEKEGAGLFKTVKAGTQPVVLSRDEVEIRQGWFEGSNVHVVDELVGMIAAHRAYETYQKLTHTSADMNSHLLATVAD